jgi:hypothetical protein
MGAGREGASMLGKSQNLKRESNVPNIPIIFKCGDVCILIETHSMAIHKNILKHPKRKIISKFSGCSFLGKINMLATMLNVPAPVTIQARTT